MSSPSSPSGEEAAQPAAQPEEATPAAAPPGARGAPAKRKRGRPSAADKAAEAAALAAAQTEEEQTEEEQTEEEQTPAAPQPRKRKSAEVAAAVAAAARRERVRAILERSFGAAAEAGALAGAAARLRDCVPAFPVWAQPMASLAVDVWPLSVEIAAVGLATDDDAIDALIARAPYAALGIPLAVAGGASISLRRAKAAGDGDNRQ